MAKLSDLIQRFIPSKTDLIHLRSSGGIDGKLEYQDFFREAFNQKIIGQSIPPSIDFASITSAYTTPSTLVTNWAGCCQITKNLIARLVMTSDNFCDLIEILEFDEGLETFSQVATITPPVSLSRPTLCSPKDGFLAVEDANVNPTQGNLYLYSWNGSSMNLEDSITISNFTSSSTNSHVIPMGDDWVVVVLLNEDPAQYTLHLEQFSIDGNNDWVRGEEKSENTGITGFLPGDTIICQLSKYDVGVFFPDESANSEAIIIRAFESASALNGWDFFDFDMVDAGTFVANSLNGRGLSLPLSITGGPLGRNYFIISNNLNAIFVDFEALTVDYSKIPGFDQNTISNIIDLKTIFCWVNEDTIAFEGQGGTTDFYIMKVRWNHYSTTIGRAPL